MFFEHTSAINKTWRMKDRDFYRFRNILSAQSAANHVQGFVKFMIWRGIAKEETEGSEWWIESCDLTAPWSLRSQNEHGNKTTRTMKSRALRRNVEPRLNNVTWKIKQNIVLTISHNTYCQNVYLTKAENLIGIICILSILYVPFHFNFVQILQKFLFYFGINLF